MVTTLTVKVDAKGRLSIPQRLRAGIGIEPGDTFFVEWDETRKLLQFARVENPFDVLAEHALNEWRSGRTRTLQAFAAANDISLNDD